MSRNNSSVQSPPNENDFEAPLINQIAPLIQSRSPLNSIPDPSQCQSTHSISKVSTSRAYDRGKSAHLDSNSAQSTPVRSARRLSSVGGGSAPLTRLPGGGKYGLLPRISRGISVAIPHEQVSADVFELDEDPSFWKDHNVQVLIRIRPLNDLEMVSQGYGRCLRQESAQTVVWLGHPETRFTFDHIACESTSQEKLFRVAGLPMVDNCMSGYNSCMFAYGQTGSGKTYTMMGEIDKMDGKLSDDCGITPRIFEYMFTRITKEEESRKHERLTYSCKCSFLEIYNEHITDLLEPSSTNLQLREDLKKGVYVENLTEHSVKTVNDVLKLLQQGAANRKIAATYMNSESSRSHSVFTCTIESRWEKDSMAHLRFGRLNLVDLAGSERQKSSGAEGDRLKEAANINKSLSTLGLVIMSLVDLAQGKLRHVPYRDSRLTFLLQDSLGGNSKTAIIANVSPSTRSSNETLSTLKFAQRAKLIQNNAKINEDASGDVIVLQQQIQQLKGQLSFLMKHQHASTEVVDLASSSDQSSLGRLPGRRERGLSEETNEYDVHKTLEDKFVKTKHFKATLSGSLRREKLAEMEVVRLKSEIEQLNRLAHQREEESQRTKMMLRFHEEKIKRLELLSDGLISADKFYLDENNALREQNRLLQTKIDRNPEVTRFARENIRLLEQIRSYQDFHEQGERETLVAEISELRNQVLELLETSHAPPQFTPLKRKQELEVAEELERCKEMNSTLVREIDELRLQIGKGMDCDNFTFNSIQQGLPINESVDGAPLENLKGDNAVNMKNGQQIVDMLQFDKVHTQLMDAEASIDTKRLEQIQLIKELQSIQTENQCLRKLMGSKGSSQSEIENFNMDFNRKQVRPRNHDSTGNLQANEETNTDILHSKLARLSCDLKEAHIRNRQYKGDHTRLVSQEGNAEFIRNEVELESTQTLIHLQDEMDRLQSVFQLQVCSLTEQNVSLRKSLAAKEHELKKFRAEWERAMLELTTFLVDGSRSLGDASCQINSISSSFSNVNDWIGEHVEKAAKICLEKEETILLLQKSLEDAKKVVIQMQQNIYSLMGATIALTELRHMGKSTLGGVSSDLYEVKVFAENELIPVKAQITEIQDNSDCSMSTPSCNGESSMLCAHTNLNGLTDIAGKAKLAMPTLSEVEDAVNVLCSDAETYLSTLHSEIYQAVTVHKESMHEVLKEITDMRKEVDELKRNQVSLHNSNNAVPSCAQLKPKNQLRAPQKIRNELAEVNKRLSYMNSWFYNAKNMHGHLDSVECSSGTEEWTSDCSSSCSNYSVQSVDNDEKSPIVMYGSIYNTVESKLELNCDEVSSSSPNQVVLDLLMEYRKAHGAFVKLRDHLMEFCVGETDRSCVTDVVSLGGTCAPEDLKEHGGDRHHDPTNKIYAGSKKLVELVVEEKSYPPISFFDKFDEAYATIKEADDMLKAMLKANETANMSTTMWKQAGEDLMADKVSLSKEIKQLKSSIFMGDAEKEIANILSLLEGCFLQMRTGVEEVFEAVRRDVVLEMHAFCCSFRSSLEDLMCKAIENDLSTFLFQRQIVEHYEKLRRRKSMSTPDGFVLHKGWVITTVPEQDQEDTNDNSDFHDVKYGSVGDQIEYLSRMNSEDVVLAHDDENGNNNSDLAIELIRKDTLLKGLLFDFSSLQEFASHRKDIKDELEKLIVAMSKVQHELQSKTVQLDDVLVQNMKLEGQLAEAQQALSDSNHGLDEAKGKLDIIAAQNIELKDLLKDLYVKNSKADQLLEEQKEAIKSLEEEIVRLSSSEKQLYPSEEDIKDTLMRVTAERDELVKILASLQDRFNMACTLADENQAIAAEAHQESEACKSYAEQKEEEVKILEHSVEELECTINVLEKKVSEMEDELERHRLVRDSLEVELQELRHRLSTVEDLTESFSSENYVTQPEDQLFRKLQSKSEESDEAHEQIRVLQEENARQAKEIKLFKDYISEVVLHAEAQASHYQQKYKDLEAMLNEVKTDLANVSGASTLEKAEKNSTRARGSSSPFKCIAGLVHQMNQEKDQELLIARLRIEDLEAQAAIYHREVCILNTRLASSESMTHDIIRDLLGVKLDLSNYANIIDQHQLQSVIEDAHHQRQESVAMEQEIANLRSQIDDLLEERERCISEINNNKEQQLTTEIMVEQVQERDQLLAAQNNMLKKDKCNLQKRIVELDDLVKTLQKVQDTQPRKQMHTTQTLRSFDPLGERLADSQKIFSRFNNQIAQYGQPGSDTLNMRPTGTKLRKHKP